MDHDEDHPMNNANAHSNDQQRPNTSSDAAGDNSNRHTPTTHSESFVFTGTGPAFLATMQNLVNRIIMRDQQPEQRRNASGPPSTQSTDDDVDMHPRDDVGSDDSARATTSTALQSQTDATASDSTTASSPSTTSEQSSPSPTLPTGDDAATTQPSASPTPDSLPNPPSTNPSGRPIRPLPRPHSHVHAHTPFGVIDLFAFNVNMSVGGAAPQPEQQPRPQSQPQGEQQPHPHPHPPPQSQPPPPPLTATFTFNLGPEAFAGFEAMLFNHLQKEREPDMERAKTLLRGMQVVSEGLVRRLERAGGVPGGQGSEDQSSGCAVCWGPLLEGVEPGEWDSAAQKEAKEKHAAETKEQPEEDDEFRGRIVALPCAHVYHAECLLPWFSRNTTCPTCRFDIDPDSLTWNPQPPPAPPETDPPEDMPIPDGLPFDVTQEDGYRLNAAEAERLNGVFASLLRGFVGDGIAQAHQQQPRQRQEENQRDDSGAQQPSAQTQTEARDEAASTQTFIAPTWSPPPPPPPLSSSPPSASPVPPPMSQRPSTPASLPQMFGPAPPPLPPPRLHNLPAIFRLPPVPLFLFPGRPSANAPPQGQPQSPALHQPQQAQQVADREPAGQQEGETRDSTRTDSTSGTSQAAPTSPVPVPAPAQRPQSPQPSQQPQQPHLRAPFPFNLPHIYNGFPGFPGPGANAGSGAARPPQEPQLHPPNADTNTNAGPTATATATAHVFTHFPPPYPFPPFGGERMPHPHPHPGGPRERGRERGERRQWVPPEPVGRTLRQRVEAKEQELGLRCDNVVCVFAPTDEDPVPFESMNNNDDNNDNNEMLLKKRVQLHGAYDSHGRLCEHKFHPACLVSSARVAGVDDEEMEMDDKNKNAETDGDEEGEGDESEIELACPVCRADGTLSHKEWREGVKSLQETF